MHNINIIERDLATSQNDTPMNKKKYRDMNFLPENLKKEFEQQENEQMMKAKGADPASGTYASNLRLG